MEDLIFKLISNAPAGVGILLVYLLMKFNDFNHVEARQRELIDITKKHVDDTEECMKRLEISLVKIEQLLADRLPRYTNGNGGQK